MKTKILEDDEKVVYQFTHNGKEREVTYFKCCFVFFADQHVDFDGIAENDLQNWTASLQSEAV